LEDSDWKRPRYEGESRKKKVLERKYDGESVEKSNRKNVKLEEITRKKERGERGRGAMKSERVVDDKVDE
jgi:hypothetical protein